MDLLREDVEVIEPSAISPCQSFSLSSNDKNPRVILSGVFRGKVFASYGLRICSVRTGRWLMVKRRHSIEYCIFIRGTYDTCHLPLLIPKLTNKERQCVYFILKLNAEDYISYVVSCVGVEYYDQKTNTGWYKMVQNSERIVVLIGNTYPKVDLWVWPKGVKEVFDNTGYETALREFSEEVSINLPPPIKDPVKNAFIRKITCYGREIHEHYWTYLVDEEFELNNDVSREVSKRAWKKLDDFPHPE